ncbi:hypothetical protein JD276_12815 [Leucobacter sp. CSA1]|uniref:Uncharacterized protein n=1 Tax=Leucobacter chromiisoli TaxID=2796471 RepID=A0A934UW53_9MICO|nr:hypothetical protein [Leucobacter chromiisoli]MBK0419913.1 hypothetical protein [Leucobacter chromiisoli]
MPRVRPSWQRHLCPPWCTVVHTEQDHPDDRTHRDDGVALSVVARRRTFVDSTLVERTEERTLILGRWQRDGDRRRWFFLGDDEGLELELDEASFVRLIHSMSALATEAPTDVDGHPSATKDGQPGADESEGDPPAAWREGPSSAF